MGNGRGAKASHAKRLETMNRMAEGRRDSEPPSSGIVVSDSEYRFIDDAWDDDPGPRDVWDDDTLPYVDTRGDRGARVWISDGDPALIRLDWIRRSRL